MSIKNLQKAIDYVGGLSELARGIGVSKQRIYNWLHKSLKVPAEYCIVIELFTGSYITRHDLRPDIYPE